MEKLKTVDGRELNSWLGDGCLTTDRAQRIIEGSFSVRSTQKRSGMGRRPQCLREEAVSQLLRALGEMGK